MHASFALIDALREEGHVVRAQRGLHRPLIGVVAAATERAWWDGRIGGRLRFDWHDVAPASLGLVDAVPALRLHDAGCVDAGTLLAALRAASAATVVVDRVTAVVANEGRGGVVTTADGGRIAARTLLWCGGAWGAWLLDGQEADAVYKPGSLVEMPGLVTREPLSFGLYAAPSRASTTWVGPTSEGSQASFPDAAVPSTAVALLEDRIARVFGTTMAPCARWRGVRLVRLSTRATASLAGVDTVAALGSRGFLTAPLLAARWARSL